MERFVKGDVIVVPYPAFDLKSLKKRPAIILAISSVGAIVCPVTSKNLSRAPLIPIKSSDFSSGSIKTDSFALPLWLSTFKFSHILYKAGHLKDNKFREILDKVCSCLKEN
jgi:mRNA interferase MazF